MITARRLVITGIVAGAAFLFVYAFTLGAGDVEVTITDDAVERFIPADGSPLEPRQTRIGVDLTAGWTAALQVDGVEIPEDQVNCFDDCFDPRPGADPQDIVFYAPGMGKVIERLASGRRCAVATIWRPALETRADGRSVTWCFRVA